jgi:hypothetical protein
VDLAAPSLAGIVAAGGGVSFIEICLAAFAVVVLAALLVLRARRDRNMKIRRAASEGYYDPDAARFGGGGIASERGRPVVDPSLQSLAPTFVAPGQMKPPARGDKKSRGTVRASTSPRPVPSFPLDDEGRPRGVPAFDPVAAVNSRPGNW